VTEAAPLELLTAPDGEDDREALDVTLQRLLGLFMEGTPVRPDWLPPEGDALNGRFTRHLAVPLVGVDTVIGVLFVARSNATGYTEDHLALLSVVAGQLAASLTADEFKARQERHTAEVTGAWREAERANRVKDEFLAMLAHELRNPLAPILHALGVIKRLAGEHATIQNAISRARRQTTHLARLLDDLLDLGRIEGGMELRREPVEIRGALNDVLDTYRPAIDASRLQVSLSLPDGPLFVDADPARLQQIIGNLISNATKYTPAGGVIAVTVRPDGRQLVLGVKDSGIGIGPELLPNVFDLFTQAHPAPPGPRRGFGVGLALVRRLVELHGGAVEARSEGPGQGSEFLVRLPLATAPHPQSPAPARPLRRPGPRHVLIVEDNEDAREMLRAALELEGHRVDVAEDGQRGIEKAVEVMPDAIVLDVGLPGIDGYEVARRLRERLGTRVRLIALTGYDQPEHRRLAAQAGVDAHLVKPMDLGELLLTLEG
jgi:signal transduction histidine kinase